jgi:serine/threonine-protein kinase
LIEAGQTIGSYRILQKIGTGGMGAVYLAEHPLIGKKVALKVIHRELANNKDVVERFLQEAKAVTQIGNEHIVSIHDFGQTAEGDHFYIMEYLEGQTLAQVLGRERVLDVMRAMHIGAQIGAALGAAHASGVVHRDLKPDNVMLTMRLGDPDFVVMLDFGLAKVFREGPSAVKTAAGVLLGTPQYMSPEACESRSTLDHRTDVYALGILLFQMLTGMLPFDGESMGEVLVKQVTQLPPPPRQFNPSIPPSIEQIVLRCLAKSPDARFQNMNALRDALRDPEGYLRNSPPMAPARSLAPGEVKVDGKMVMAYAAAEQAAKMRTGALPLIPPPQAPVSTTAKTMIHDPSSAPVRAPQAGEQPAMAAPNMPKMNTMRIATPIGYSSRPPRRMWPIVLIVSLVLGLGGGAFAVAWFGRKDSAGTASAAGDAGAVAGSASRDVAPPDAKGSAAVTAGSAGSAGSGTPATAAAGSNTPTVPAPAGSATAVPMAVIVIDSVPPGAEVIGADKVSYGKTPAHLSLPISDMPLEFELRLSGYRKKVKQLVVSGNTVVQVTLDRAPTQTAPGGKGTSGSKKNHNDTMLERPD